MYESVLLNDTASTAFVTGNAGKLREVREILGAANIEVESQELDSTLHGYSHMKTTY